MGDLIKTVLPLAIAVAFPALSPFALLAIQIASSFVLGQIFKTKQKKTEGVDNSLQNKSADRRRIIRSSVSSRRYAYGRSEISGTLIFAETSGVRDQFLHMVVTIAGHVIESVDNIFFNDIDLGTLDANGFVTTGKFANFVRVKIYLGGAGQVADPDLVAETSSWTNNHVGNGIAYAYIRLEWDDDSEAFPTGIPTPKFRIKGKNDLLDPRDSSVGYSDNSALCCYDYLRGQHGYGADDSEINTSIVIASANVCDEQVQNPDLTFHDRYNCNGTFDLDEKLGNVMENLLSSMGGTLVEHQGTFRLYAASAGIVTRETLNEDDLRGDIIVNPTPTRDRLFNAVRGTYTSPDDRWLPTDFKAVTLSQWQVQDGGEKINRDIELSFTIDEYQAQRLAWTELKLARDSLTYTVPVKLNALDIATWDMVNWSIANLGWLDKPFRVIGWKLSDSGGINLIMQEESSASYDDDVNELQQKDNTPNTNLPDGSKTETISGIELNTGDDALTLSGISVISGIIATWIPSGTAFSVLYDVMYKKSADTEWIETTHIHPPTATILIKGVDDGISYDVRIRAINGLGVAGPWSQATGIIIGKTAPPPNVLTFKAVSQSVGTREFSWSTLAAPPLDLAGYRIRGKLGTGFDWDGLDPIHNGLLISSPYETNTLSDAGVYTFGIKSYDTTGNESVDALLIEANLGIPNISDLILERNLAGLQWPGIKTNCFVDLFALVVSSTDTWDTLPNQWNNWNLWTQNLYTTASYEDEEIDLTLDLNFQPLTAIQVTNMNIVVEYRWKVDGGVYNSYQTVNGIVEARYIQMRITMTPISISLDSRIDNGLLRLEAPILEEDLTNFDTSTLTPEPGGGVRLPITLNFSQIKNVFIALILTGDGYTWEIVDKDPDLGPWIRIYDKSNQVAYPLIDAQIKGV